MRYSQIVLLSAVGLFSSGSWADPPATPTGLRITIYSSSTAELFWERPTTPDLTYEVSRDDRLLVKTGGVSTMDRTYRSGEIFFYSVVAINANGERSLPAELLAGDPPPPVDTTPPPPEDMTPPTEIALDTPTGLRIDIYSPRSAELFWNRSAIPGLFYEITKDGVILDLNFGVSFFDRNFDNSRTSVYQIIANDGTGGVSSPARLSVGADSTLPPEPDDNNAPPDANGPLAPENARIEVYSSTAAELFWDRPPAFQQVVNTEIKRDGQVVANTQGISFYDNTRARDVNYTYTLTAIDSQGRRSPPTQIAFNSESLFIDDIPGTLQGLSREINFNANTQVPTDLSDLYFGTDGAAPFTVLGEPELVEREDGVIVTRTPVTCIGGGSYTYDLSGGVGGMASFEVNECHIYGSIYNGSFSIIPSKTGLVIIYDEFTGNALGTELTIHRGRAENFTFLGEATSIETIEGMDYTSTTDSNEVRVRNLSLKMTDASARSQRTSLEVSFQVSAPWTDNRFFSVTTLEKFIGGDSGNGYASGRLRLDSNAGASLEIDAIAGGSDEFDVSYFHASGGGGSLQRWGRDFELPCISTSRNDVRPLENCQIYSRTSIQ